MRNLHLLVELYQFLPQETKNSKVKDIFKGDDLHTLNDALQQIELGSNLDRLEIQSNKSRSSVGGRYRTIQYDRYGDSKKENIKNNLVKLAKKMIEKFEKVSTAFR